ncbi:MAG: fibronectin type III domain-containing protein, partial [Lachnospiraceae bacterium]|nr:fibronectin type III domain-containing protein [Lachnospiraceae bacterium]
MGKCKKCLVMLLVFTMIMGILPADVRLSRSEASSTFAINLSAVKCANSQASVSWNEVPGAVGYDLQIHREGRDWGSDSDYNGGTAYISTDLYNLVYYYRVRARFSDGSYSDWVEVWVNISNGAISGNNGSNKIIIPGSGSTLPPTPTPMPTATPTPTPYFSDNNIIDRIDMADVFEGLKQPEGDTKCPFYACLAMFRRAALLNGDSDWKEFTVTNYQDKWANPLMIYTPSAHNMSGYTFAEDTFWRNGKFYPNMSGLNASDKKQAFINLLTDHPEGIVIYSWKRGNAREHALLLTHYNPLEDKFYCTDSGITRQGIIPLVESSLADIYHIGAQYGRACKNDLEVMDYIDQYWAIIEGVDASILEEPKNLRIENKNESLLNILWDSVDRAITYEVRYKYGEDNWDILTYDNKETAYQFSGLVNNVKGFGVRAKCSKGYSG